MHDVSDNLGAIPAGVAVFGVHDLISKFGQLRAEVVEVGHDSGDYCRLDVTEDVRPQFPAWNAREALQVCAPFNGRPLPLVDSLWLDLQLGGELDSPAASLDSLGERSLGVVGFGHSAPIINSQLMTSQAKRQLLVQQPVVDARDDGRMQQKHLSGLTERVVRLLEGESLGETSRKLALGGCSITPAGIHKWKKGGNISDANIEALARVYKTTPEWIKYGTGPMRVLSEGEQAAAELAGDEAIHGMLSDALEYLRFQIQKSPLMSKDPAAMARYFRLLDAITKSQPPR